MSEYTARSSALHLSLDDATAIEPKQRPHILYELRKRVGKVVKGARKSEEKLEQWRREHRHLLKLISVVENVVDT